MSVRRKTLNRRILIRTCYVCGRTFSTTADTPFVRQLQNVEGKKQKTCYFCSEKCKQSTYKHLFDNAAWKRKKERDAKRDVKEKNRKYYEAHREEICRKRREYYKANVGLAASNSKYQREKRKLINTNENTKKELIQSAIDCLKATNEQMNEYLTVFKLKYPNTYKNLSEHWLTHSFQRYYVYSTAKSIIETY